MKRIILPLLFLFFIAASLSSQQPHMEPDRGRNFPREERSLAAEPKDRSERQVIQRSDTEVYLSYSVLAFALIIIALQSAVMLRTSRGWGPQSTRVFGITLTVTMGAFLITAGYSQNQI